MATVHKVEKARKDYSGSGIKKGESYYWWKFRYGGKFMSKTYPRASQLTQSDFLGSLYGHLETLEDLTPDMEVEDIKATAEGVSEEIRALGEEQSDKLSNMPDSLQQGPTGEMLQNRADECENMASEIEGVEMDIEDGLSDDDKKNRVEEIISELQGISYNGE